MQKLPFLLREENGACVACMTGLWCPLGSTLSGLLNADGTANEEPHLLIGYNSEILSPVSAFKCAGSNCPGGAPGTCAGGLSGSTCGSCGPGEYVALPECRNCGAFIPGMWIAFFILLILGNVCSYILATGKYTHKATSLLCITTSLGMLVVLLQNVGVLHGMPIPWPDGLSNLLRFAAFFLLSLEGLGLSCLTGGMVSEYVVTTGIFWLLLVILPVSCHAV